MNDKNCNDVIGENINCPKKENEVNSLFVENEYHYKWRKIQCSNKM